MEQTYKLIYQFDFSDENRDKFTISDSSKITVSREGGIRLKRLNSHFAEVGQYSTDDDLYVASWLANPNSLRAFLAFDFESGIRPEIPTDTQVRFRLSLNGTDQLWWSGAAWATPAAGEWNTVQEINDNIAALAATDRKIQVLVNLKTSNSEVTPVVQCVAVLYSSFIDFEYDIIFDSLVPYLEAIRPVKDWALELVADTTTLDLASVYTVEPFDIQDVTEVYNHDDDPNHNTNLLSSYNPSTKLVTMTSSQLAGKRIWVRFEYKPQVVVQAHQDFGLVEKIPAIILEDINDEQGAPLAGKSFVRDRAAKTAVIVHAPYRMDLRVTARIVTDRERDMAAISTALNKRFQKVPLLKSTGLDEEYTLNLNREFDNVRNPNLSDLKQRRMVFDILEVNYWTEGDEDGNVVTSLIGLGDTSFTSGTV